jgi:hypothetical protein
MGMDARKKSRGNKKKEIEKREVVTPVHGAVFCPSAPRFFCWSL